MYFGTKSYLKSNHYHTSKHPLSHDTLLPRLEWIVVLGYDLQGYLRYLPV
jgi:hypothetical protein